MEYGEFLSILLPYKKFQEETSELNSIGFDFFEGKYQLADSVYKLFQNFFEKSNNFGHDCNT